MSLGVKYLAKLFHGIAAFASLLFGIYKCPAGITDDSTSCKWIARWQPVEFQANVTCYDSPYSPYKGECPLPSRDLPWCVLFRYEPRGAYQNPDLLCLH